MKIGVVYRMDRAIARRRLVIWAGILVISALLRLAYYSELQGSPVIHQHLWAATDMNYFDRWARAIASGDWLSRRVDPPVHNWQGMLAEEFYQKHPAERPATLPGESETDAVQRRDVQLWKTWSGEGKFFQEPLYPYLLAATYRFIGDDVRCVFAWQMVLGIALNVLVYLAARRTFGDLAGLVAAMLVVFYSPLLVFELILLRDSTIAFATLALTWLTMEALRRPRTIFWVILGIACGVSVVLKSHFLAAIGVIGALALWQFAGRWKKALWLVTMFGGGVLIGILLLVVRNLIVGVSPFAMAGSAAQSFIITNAEDAGGATWGMSHIIDIQAKTHGAFFPTVIETLRTHGSVGHYLLLFCAKFDAMWRWYEYPGNENFYYYRLYSSTLRYLPFTYFFVGPLGLVGLLIVLGRIRRHPAIYLPIVINLPVLLVFFVQARYRIAFAAGLIPFAGYTVACVVHAAADAKRYRAAAVVAAVGLIMLWTGRPLPVGTDPIRPADFSAPYFYYYGPKIQALIQQGKAKDALIVFDDAITCQPTVVRDFQPGQAARSEDEAEMLGTFSQLYLQYAAVANAAGDHTKASEAAALSNALSLAAQRPK